MSAQHETLAPDSLAPASLVDVKPAERLKKVKAYARARLRAEVAQHDRGYQAMLAKKLGSTTAHMANMVNHERGPGERLLQALCEHWGISRDVLDAEALGSPAPISSSRPRSNMVESVRRAIELRAQERSLSAEVVDAALQASGQIGISAIEAEQIDNLLDLAIGFDRGMRLIFRTVTDAGTQSARDDLDGSRRRRKR